MKGKVFQTLLSAPRTSSNTLKHPQAPQTPYPVPPRRALTALKHLLVSLRGI